jgi:hypothetical protein
MAEEYPHWRHSGGFVVSDEFLATLLRDTYITYIALVIARLFFADLKSLSIHRHDRLSS